MGSADGTDTCRDGQPRPARPVFRAHAGPERGVGTLLTRRRRRSSGTEPRRTGVIQGAPAPVSPVEVPSVSHVHVAIVGTGFGGVGAAVRLLQEGERSLAVFERSGGVGGVWRANRYPGAACDVQSHLYEFSFAPNPGWSRRFSPQPEIEAYLAGVAERFGVLPYVRFGHDVLSAAWDEAAALWRIATSRGAYTADVLVAAPGALAAPRLPDIPGLDTFAGRTVHTSRWPEGLDLAGRRVAVVGTGASAIQVVPAIQPTVEHLTVFQRTAPWVMPRYDRALAAVTRRALRRAPAVQRGLRAGLYGLRETYGLTLRHPALAAQVERVARFHLRRQVRDADLRHRLTPDYRFGCKRVLLSDTYYPALTRPNVTVVDGAAAEVRPGGVVGPDGREHAADVLVFATGFYVTSLPFARRVAGRGGQRLSDAWGESPTAHVGTTVAGFPNLFVLQGPNTGLGHSSVILTIEAQVEHVVNALRFLRRSGHAAVEPRPEAQAAFAREVDRLSEGTVWTSGGCASWYLDATGRNAALWPGTVAAFRRRVEPFHPADYRLIPLPGREVRPADDPVAAAAAHA